MFSLLLFSTLARYKAHPPTKKPPSFSGPHREITCKYDHTHLGTKVNLSTMAKSVCICQDKSSVNQDEIQHPTFTDIENALPIYQEKGYIVVRGLFSADEVAQARSEISSICSQWYANYLKTGQEDETSNEIANRRPAWKEGHWRPAPGQEELGFRKLFRMTLHNDFFVRKAKHEKVNLQSCVSSLSVITCMLALLNTDRSNRVPLFG